jgi:hypothetical protein
MTLVRSLYNINKNKKKINVPAFSPSGRRSLMEEENSQRRQGVTQRKEAEKGCKLRRYQREAPVRTAQPQSDFLSRRSGMNPFGTISQPNQAPL